MRTLLVVSFVHGVALASIADARAEETLKKPDYSASERIPIKLAILTPSKAFASTSLSEIIRLADSVVVEKTDLTVEPIDLLVPEGQQKFTWLVRRARPDYEPTRPELQQKTFDAIRTTLRSAARPPAKFLVIVSVRKFDAKDRLSAILLDTDEALHCIYDGEHPMDGTPDTPDKDTAIEDCIVHYAVRANPEPESVDEAGVQAYLRKLFLEEFRPEFEARGDWDPYGQLAIEGTQPGIRIDIDHRAIGTTKPVHTIVGAISAGPHTVVLSGDPRYEPAEQLVTIERGKVEYVTIDLAKRKSVVVRTMRGVVTWSGVGLAVAGAAITGYALEQAATQPKQLVCIPQCSSQFIGAGVNRSSMPTAGNPNMGIPLAPLGYSLGAMGLVWALGTPFLSDDDSIPWLPLSGGVAIFAASLLLSLALNGKN
jgi:hypothetical protein